MGTVIKSSGVRNAFLNELLLTLILKKVSTMPLELGYQYRFGLIPCTKQLLTINLFRLSIFNIN